LPGLDGGGAAAAVPPAVLELCGVSDICSSNISVNYYIFCFEKTTAMSCVILALLLLFQITFCYSFLISVQH